MSDIMAAAVDALNKKLGDDAMDGVVKFSLGDMGSIVIDANGARVGDDEADVTLTADAETFQEILSGELNPTAAFMTGKLAVDGDMGMAMKLGSVLA